MNPIKLDRRRQYYIVLDTETATLPHSMDFDGEARKRIAIAKPLVYDLAWSIIDRTGKVYGSRSFLISEIFSVPQIFNTAYYASKRPLYIEKLNKGEIDLVSWKIAAEEMVKDIELAVAVGAYNSMFDYKKAIKFTEEYITNLYSDHYYEWETEQKRRIDYIVENPPRENDNEFNPDVFEFRGKSYPLFDIWGLACKYLLNCDEYKQMCIDNNWQTASGKYFKTSAETAFRFFSGNMTFDEAHTAIDDCDIEAELFAEIIKRTKNKWEMGITLISTIDKSV